MIGPLINIYKGKKTNNNLKKRLAQAERQLDGLHSLDDVLARIEAPYDRVMAKHQFLLAEYYEQRAQGLPLNELKTIWEMVKEEMAATIEETEQQLQGMTATKLDIARIVASLTQLSHEFDLELQALKEKGNLTAEKPQQDTKYQQLQSMFIKRDIELAVLKAQINNVKNQYQELLGEFEKPQELREQLAALTEQQMTANKAHHTMQREIAKLQSSGQELESDTAELKATIETHAITLALAKRKEKQQQAVNEGLQADVQKLEAGERALTEQTAQLQQMTKEQGQAQKRFETRTEATLVETEQTLKEKIDHVAHQLKATNEAITLLEQDVDMQMHSLQQQLHTFKAEWTAHAATMDAAIVAQARAQKKSLLQWTVPLYVMVAGIIVALLLF